MEEKIDVKLFELISADSLTTLDYVNKNDVQNLFPENKF